jgi:uncharacterized protein YkwD
MKGFIMFKNTLIGFVLVISFVGCGEQPNTTTSKKDLTDFDKPYKQEILDALNRARSKPRDCHDGRGLISASQPLVWSDELYSSAHEHSYDLAHSNTFDHLGSGTEYDITGSGKRSLFFERIESNGYINYYIVGENIAGGQNSLDSVMEALLNSPDHCANIMNPKYKEVGVAIVVNPDSEYGIYWTQNFGGKK